MDSFDRITSDPAILDGQPCIRGLRLTVRRVLKSLATYPDRSVLRAEYPELEDEDIRQALEYAAKTVRRRPLKQNDDERERGVDRYLGYLKLEMNIMAILSAFCVAALSLALKECVAAAKGSHLQTVWQEGAILVCSATALLLVGALAFYRQRSLLAYIYGWLCLWSVSPRIADWSMEEILEDADSWKTWRFYRLGFACLVSALVIDLIALVQRPAGWNLGKSGMIESVLGVTAAIGIGFALCEFRLSRQ